MKLTSKQLKNIIKEELESVMSEAGGDIEQKLIDVLKMQIWSAMGGAYADKDKAEADAAAQVEDMKKAGADLKQEFERVDAENREAIKAITSKIKPYVRAKSHGMDQSDVSSGYAHPSRNEE